MKFPPQKYKQGDYVRADFGSGHVKAIINGVKRNRNFDKALRERDINDYRVRYNASGWFYQVAKHYGTGQEDVPDLRNAHWSRNLKLEISERDIFKVIPADSKFKLKYLKQGMTHQTFEIVDESKFFEE